MLSQSQANKADKHEAITPNPELEASSIKDMLAQSQANKADKHDAIALNPELEASKYLNEAVPAWCENIRAKMNLDVKEGDFHTNSYRMTLGNMEGKVDCNLIADKVYSFFPGMGVTAQDLGDWNKCFLEINHVVDDRDILQQHRRHYFFDGEDKDKNRIRTIYTGPEPSQCQDLVAELNARQFRNEWYSNRFATAIMKNGMCEINIEEVPKP